jgi:hypothetical protein
MTRCVGVQVPPRTRSFWHPCSPIVDRFAGGGFVSHSGERPPEPPELLSGLAALGAVTASLSGAHLLTER